MATPREIRRRIRSITSITKVTRAMEMVAAAKMRRAQNAALAMRPYATKSLELLMHLAGQRGVSQEFHPLLTHRDNVAHIGAVLITSNKGLCGGYNHNVLRVADHFLAQAQAPVGFITMGRIGRNAMLRSGQDIVADFDKVSDQPSLSEITPLARVVMDDFLTGVFDEVYIIYTDFVNTMVQKPQVRPLLPLVNVAERLYVGKASTSATPKLVEYTYEPNPEQLLEVVLPRFIELQIFEALLEAKASEHSARMVAMRAATENALDLVGDLTLSYNQARQAAITKEMLDIVGGTEALAQASRQ